MTRAALDRVPPGPPQRRGGVIGDIAYYLRFMRDPMGFVAGRFDTYGDIYYTPTDDGGLYVLKHPEHLREVLATRSASFAKKHTAFETLQKVLGDGLLTTDGEVWKRHRRMLQPAFNKKRMAGYGEAMAEEARVTAARWSDGARVDVSHEMMELTLRIVGRTLFNHTMGAETDQVRAAMNTFQSLLSRPDVLPAWMPSPQRRRFDRAQARLDAMIYGMVEERRASDLAEAPNDVLQMLITATDDEEGGDGAGLTRTEVRDHLVTLFLAGHETTSHALTWALYLLSQNRDASDRLTAELDTSLGERAPEYADLDRLPYTEQVISEAMRLYPPAYMVARRAIADTEIGGYPVAAGAEVVMWIYMTHRDPRWYPRPLEFRPERFAPTSRSALPKLAYLPFGGGPRACIGAAFAMVEARLILATLAQRYRFELAPGHRVAIEPRITLVPKGGMPMIVRGRTRDRAPARGR